MKLDAAQVLAHTGLVDWLAGGERGTSSNTIVQELTGIPACSDGYRYHPLDPADFRRCERLLRQVPTLRPLMPKMSAVSPEWAALIEHWDELVQIIDAEAPGWFNDQPARGLRASRAYARMEQLGC